MFELFFKSNKSNLAISFFTSLVWLFIVIGWISGNIGETLCIIGFWTIASVIIYGLWFGCFCIKEFISSVKAKRTKTE